VRADDRPPCNEAFRQPLEQHDVLPAAGADGLDQPATDRELRHQWIWDFGKRGRDENRVVRCVLGKAFTPIADDDRRVLGAAAGEVLPRRVREVGPPLDAPDLARESREQGGLPPVAGSNLEHALGAGQRQRLDHPGDERRLCGHLAVRNRQRSVEIRLVGERHRDELAPGKVTDRLEESRVADPREAERLEQSDVGRAGGHGTILPAVTTWPASADELVEHQLQLAEAAPTPWQPGADALVGGCFVCSVRGKHGSGAAGDALWGAAATAEEAVVVEAEAGAPYQPGLLALREGPALAAAVLALELAPDVLLVDGTGRDHPRRAGLALHLGAVLDLPTVGVTHRPLVADGPWPAGEQGARSPLLLGGALVGFWLRTRPGIRPLAVHAAWRTEPETAVEIVLGALSGYRAPEPLRRARRVAREARSAAL
jgi:deoxyribonuclease V